VTSDTLQTFKVKGSINLELSYNDLKIENVGPFAMLDFKVSKFQPLRDLPGPIVHQYTEFERNSTIRV